MAAVYGGSGDPKRTIDLLWGIVDQPKRGRKPKVTVEQIAVEAIALADNEGLAALSMRRLAQRLGVGAMTLYTYLPSKAELVDLMVDRVTARYLQTPEATPNSDWREGLEAAARRDWNLYRQHPWMLQLSTTRPILGPSVFNRYEHDLRLIDNTGLSDVDMDAVVSMLDGFVRGVATSANEFARSYDSTGQTDQEWWDSFGPELARVANQKTYPVSTRVGDQLGEQFQAANQPEYVFEFGLQRLLDGISALIKQPGVQ